MNTTSPPRIRDPWPGTLTARERLKRQLRGESVDRCFHWEFGYWTENFQTWEMFRTHGISSNAEAESFFGFDEIRTIWAGTWMQPVFKEEILEETASHRIIRNPDGLLAEVPKDGHETIPHFLTSSIQTPEDWETIKAERFDPDHPDRRIDAEVLRDRHPDDHEYVLAVNAGSVIGKIRDMLTFEGLAYACHDYPEMVEDMVETTCVLIEQHLDRVCSVVQPDLAWGWEDICFRSGPLVSLGFFREVLIPRYRRIREKLDSYGIDLWLTDCDGDIRPLLPDWLDVGLDIMFPFEVSCSGHPGELMDRFPNLRIWGGVDKMELRKGRDAIRSYLESLVPLVERGGFIPGCDHRCPPDVQEEDYLYYLDLKRDMFG